MKNETGTNQNELNKTIINKWVGNLSRQGFKAEEIDKIVEEHNFFYLQSYNQCLQDTTSKILPIFTDDTMLLLNKINDLLAFGIDVTFGREINQFRITLSKDGHESQTVVLPFDHLNEKRICDYINLMKDKFNVQEEKD